MKMQRAGFSHVITAYLFEKRSNLLHVQPDILPKGSSKIESVWIDDQLWNYFDAENFTVKLLELDHRLKIKVRIIPC